MPTTDEIIEVIRNARNSKKSVSIDFTKIPPDIDINAIKNELSQGLPPDIAATIQGAKKFVKIDFAKVPISTEPHITPTEKPPVATTPTMPTMFGEWMKPVKPPTETMIKPEMLTEFEKARQKGVEEAGTRFEDTLKKLFVPHKDDIRYILLSQLEEPARQSGEMYGDMPLSEWIASEKQEIERRNPDVKKIEPAAELGYTAMVIGPSLVSGLKTLASQIAKTDFARKILIRDRALLAPEDVPIGQVKLQPITEKTLNSLSDAEVYEVYKSMPDNIKTNLVKHNPRVRSIVAEQERIAAGVRPTEPVKTTEPIQEAKPTPEVIPTPEPIKPVAEVKPPEPEVQPIIPKELKPLAKEARKYKSPEEFVSKLSDKVWKDFVNYVHKEPIKSDLIPLYQSIFHARYGTKAMTVEDIKRVTDFYNLATKGVKEVKPEVKPTAKQKYTKVYDLPSPIGTKQTISGVLNAQKERIASLYEGLVPDDVRVRKIGNKHYFYVPEGAKKKGAIPEKPPVTEPTALPSPLTTDITQRPGYIKVEDVPKMVQWINRYFTRSRGVVKEIDEFNEKRLGEIWKTYFDAPITGKNVRQWIDKHGEKAQKLVYDALHGEIPMDRVPEEIRTDVQKMREDIDNLSKILIEKGAIPENLRAVLKKNIGKYVSRRYRLFEDKYYEPSREVIERAKAKLREMHPRTLGKLSDDEMEGVIKSILDRKDFTLYTAGKKPITVPQNHFVKRKDLPQELRDLFGEITDPVLEYLKTMTDLTVISHNTEFLNNISRIPGVFSDVPTSIRYKRIPEGKSWGAIAGKYTDEATYEFLMDTVGKTDNWVVKFIENYVVDPFKATKTIFSVPTHIRNFLGNTAFSIFADCSITNPSNWRYYTKALEIITKKETTYREMWKQLIEDGIVEVQYWGSEMPKLMDELLKTEPSTWGDKIMEWGIKKPINFMGELYNAEDQIYRISAYLKQLEQGKSRAEAKVWIDTFFTNYRKVPKAIGEMRKWAVLGPFLSFKAETARIYYNAGKMAIQDAKKGNFSRLIKFLFVLTLPELMSKVLRETHDIDEKEIEKLNRIMPVYRRGSAIVYYRDGKGRIKAFDLTYILPHGDYDKAVRALLAGDLEAFGDSLNFFEHPLIGVYEIIKEGRQPYTKYDIGLPRDTKAKMIADRVFEVVKDVYLPLSSPIPDIGALAKGQLKPGRLTGYQIANLIDAYNETADQYGRVRELPEELKNFLTGIRTWRVYPEVLKTNYIKQKRAEREKVIATYNSWFKRNPNATQEEISEKTKELTNILNKIDADIELANSIDIEKLEPNK